MPYPKNQVEKVCENCGKVFSIKVSTASHYRFCSMACRTQAKTVLTNCQHCGKEFTTYKKNIAKYCSISCGITARNLTSQNPSYHRDISGENNPMFGKGLRGPSNGMYGRNRESNPAWKGGHKYRKDGYCLVAVPVEHPYAIDGIYVLEHRFVMEQHLGRYLLPCEIVHHIDGDHGNNAIENLRLYASQSEHLCDAHNDGSFGLS